MDSPKLTKSEVIEILRDDEEYYTGLGKNYMSNSDISAIFRNPEVFIKQRKEGTQPKKKAPALIIGNYFHQLILEPEKAANFKISEADKRTLKEYKEEAGDDMMLLRKEADMVETLRDKIMSNAKCLDYITGNVEYEVPNIGEINGLMWKGKADILNHDKKLIIDLKTSANINKFRQASKNYNYDSQAYIYTQLFPGYSFLFIVIDKETQRIGIYDTSDYFMYDGKSKVADACYIYKEVTSSEYSIKENVHTQTL